MRQFKGIGNGRISAFTSAPGSAGTIAAGDEIKKMFPEAKIATLEPYECSTLANGGCGQHRIEGIGDKMCTLIHNVLTTDLVVLIKDDDAVRFNMMKRLNRLAIMHKSSLNKRFDLGIVAISH